MFWLPTLKSLHPWIEVVTYVCSEEPPFRYSQLRSFSTVTTPTTSSLPTEGPTESSFILAHSIEICKSFLGRSVSTYGPSSHSRTLWKVPGHLGKFLKLETEICETEFCFGDLQHPFAHPPQPYWRYKDQTLDRLSTWYRTLLAKSPS